MAKKKLTPVVSWASTAVGLLAGDRLLDGVFLSGLIPSLIAALVLGLVNAFIRPILFILTLPINFLTLGLFTFVINAMMLGLAAWIVPGFAVESLWSGIGLAILIAIVHALATAFFGDDGRD